MAPFAASSIPLATLGVFILWLGWFGFNGGSQLASGTLEDVSAVATIYINTNLAAGGGVLAAATVSRVIGCLLYTSPSPRDQRGSRMPSSA